MAGRWTVQLLGGLSARRGDQVISRFRTQKTGTLLAYLALHRGEPLPRERLLDILWPESDLLAARNSLSVALSSLRSQLEPPQATPGMSPLGGVLVADRSTVSLNPDAVTTDVAAFEEAVQSARGNGGSVEALSAAVGRYAGELLPGLFDDWILAERDRLAGLYGQTLCRLTVALIDSGAPADALDYARRAMEADPLGEEPHRLLMRVYADLGRPAAVRAQLADLERRRHEAGEAPPQAETRWLAHRLAENADPAKIVSAAAPPALPPAALPSPTSRTAQAPAPPSIRPAPDHLPVPLTRFFGQEEALTALLERLHGPETRLITLTGPGGCGKTRLALEAARRSAADRAVWFVPLADLRDARRLPEAVRDSLGLPRTASADPLGQIAGRLGAEPSALVVLDNGEHLVGRGPLDPHGAAAQVRQLLRRLPDLRLLMTSRQALGILSEQEVPVALLAVPPDPDASPAALLEYPSVLLFADRARNRRVDFQVTPRNARAVAALVARLEGIPLAIEIAAARSRLLTPAQMLARLTDRFEMLVSPDGRTDIPDRQRTLWGALAWGYDLLPPDARRVLAALSVFRGDWSAAAAQAVCERAGDDSDNSHEIGDTENADLLPPGRTLECLTLLQSASLLVTHETDDEMRFRLLETVREFAATRLTETERERWERRHAAVFVARADNAYRHRRDPHQKVWLDRLEADMPNFRAVLDRFAETGTGLQLASALGGFWKLRGYYREGRAWLERALAAREADGDKADTVSPLILGRAWYVSGILAEDSAEYAAASAFHVRSADAYRAANEETSLAVVIVAQGNIAYRQGRHDDARAHYQEALAISRRLSDTQGIASALGSLGNVTQDEGRYAESRRFQEESLALSRAIGDDRMTAATLHNLGNLALCEQDPGRARAFYEESLPRKQALGDRRGVASLRSSLGFLALAENRAGDAAVYFADALRASVELGNKLDCVVAVEGVAWCAALGADPLSSARFRSSARAARAALSAPHTDEEAATFARLRADARSAAPSPAAFDRAENEGAALSLDTASRAALAYLKTAFDG